MCLLGISVNLRFAKEWLFRIKHPLGLEVIPSMGCRYYASEVDIFVPFKDVETLRYRTVKYHIGEQGRSYVDFIDKKHKITSLPISQFGGFGGLGAFHIYKKIVEISGLPELKKTQTRYLFDE